MDNNKFEQDYRELIKSIFFNGLQCPNRTGVDTIGLINKTLEIDLSKGFPIITGKKIYFKKALAEFQWMYLGRTDIAFLNDRGIHWWDKHAEGGSVGRAYGYQIRNFSGIFDQWEYAKNEVKRNSRRAIITFWNPLDFAVLPPCYTNFNFVVKGARLSMVMNIRSSDVFMGLPYDVCIGALMLHTMARQTDLIADTLYVNMADCHIYLNHLDGVREYLGRPYYQLPKLVGLDLDNYKSGEFIKCKHN